MNKKHNSTKCKNGGKEWLLCVGCNGRIHLDKNCNFRLNPKKGRDCYMDDAVCLKNE